MGMFHCLCVLLSFCCQLKEGPLKSSRNTVPSTSPQISWRSEALYIGAEVLLALVGEIFTIEWLDWTPIDHFETFSGDAAVTLAELQDPYQDWEHVAMESVSSLS